MACLWWTTPPTTSTRRAPRHRLGRSLIVRRSTPLRPAPVPFSGPSPVRWLAGPPCVARSRRSSAVAPPVRPRSPASSTRRVPLLARSGAVLPLSPHTPAGRGETKGKRHGSRGHQARRNTKTREPASGSRRRMGRAEAREPEGGIPERASQRTGGGPKAGTRRNAATSVNAADQRERQQNVRECQRSRFPQKHPRLTRLIESGTLNFRLYWEG
jgi:hypothetical protein